MKYTNLRDSTVGQNLAMQPVWLLEFLGLRLGRVDAIDDGWIIGGKVVNFALGIDKKTENISMVFWMITGKKMFALYRNITNNN